MDAKNHANDTQEADFPEGFAVPPEAYHDFWLPDDPASINIPSMSPHASYTVIRDICIAVRTLIMCTNTYVGADGSKNMVPQLGARDARRVVNGLLERIPRSVGDWVPLVLALPAEAGEALRMLSRTLDQIRIRWHADDKKLLEMFASTFHPASGKTPRRAKSPPVRRIRTNEVKWMEQSLNLIEPATNAYFSSTYPQSVSGGTARNRAGRTRATDEKSQARSKWVYDALKKSSLTYKCILTDFRNACKQNGWRPVSTAQGLKHIADSYADRLNLPRIPTRQGR